MVYDKYTKYVDECKKEDMKSKIRKLSESDSISSAEEGFWLGYLEEGG